MGKMRALLMGGIAAIGATASAQSFNIDLDISAGGPEVGQGVPSATFGAAANQQGFWNRLGAASHTDAEPLRGLSGEVTTTTVRWNVSGGGAGSGMGNNTGDHRLLLNDRTLVTVPISYHFEGLNPGTYRITTYSIGAQGFVRPTKVTVPLALDPIKFSGQGDMPGDQFIEGITHCVHEVVVAGSSIDLTVENLIDRQFGSVNGFQVVYMPVPELGSLSWLSIGVIGLFCKRRK